MLYWADVVEYMKGIAGQHKLLNPEPLEKKTYFVTMDIDELIIGSTNSLPDNEDGGFMVWISNQTVLEPQPQVKDQKTFMFYILKQYEDQNIPAQNEARDETERIAVSVINRMVKDSQSGVFWKHSFEAANAQLDAVLKKEFTSKYVGWQIAFNVTTNFKGCFQIAEWHDGGTPPTPPANFVLLSNSDDTWTAEAENGKPFEIQDVPWELRNSLGDLISSGSSPYGATLQILAPDEVHEIFIDNVSQGIVTVPAQSTNPITITAE